MNIALQNASEEIQEAILQIAMLMHFTPEEAFQKSKAIQELWRLGTLEDGIVLLLDLARVDHAIKT